MFETLTRRNVLGLAGGVAAASLFARQGNAADPLKIGVFITLSGGAALFGKASRAAAQYGAAKINAEGGILGRPVELVIADGGAAPAEAAKSAQRMTLGNSVDAIVGSHDSAVRQAIETAIKGKVPYIYTPVFEGKDCTPHTYFLGETPEQQVGASLNSIIEIAKGKSVYLIGNDYVWPRVTNDVVKAAVAKAGGKIVGEEYYPLGAANKFESSIEKIKAAAPSIVLITLVGGDNVNFNRTFASFGLASKITRMSCLLEENTLLGIGAEASENLYSCMDYFANLKTPENQAYLKGIAQQADGDSVQNTVSKSVFDGLMMVQAVAKKASSIKVAEFDAAVEGTSFATPSGLMVMSNRHTSKTMYLAKCVGTQFEVIETYKDVATGQVCK